MTVVVGFVGADCAVMASDSEGTESGHTRFDVEKIWTCGGLLVGYSGSNAVRSALALSIEGSVTKLFGDSHEIDRQTARTALAAATASVLRQYYSEFVETTKPIDQVLAGVLLVIGRDPNGHWLLEIDANNTTTFYEDRGLQAIGSGGAAAFAAHALLRHYEPRDRPIEELRLIAFRTVQTCIDVLGGAYGVGGEVQLWSCTAGTDGYTKGGAELMESLQDGLDKWTLIEKETLAQVFGGSPPEEPDNGEGVPDAIEEAEDESADDSGTTHDGSD